jgi:hypothetical protein
MLEPLLLAGSVLYGCGTSVQGSTTTTTIDSVIALDRFAYQVLPSGWSTYTHEITGARLEWCQHVYWSFLGFGQPGWPSISSTEPPTKSFLTFGAAAGRLVELRQDATQPSEASKVIRYPADISRYVTACKRLKL